jgi:hypothetical protein
VLLSAYGVDSLSPDVSLRRIWVLVNRLPPSYRTPGEHWSTESELLALLIDHVAQLTWITLRANGAKANKPKPLPRPPARSVSGPMAPSAPPRATPAARGPAPSATWADAISKLAGLPSVEVHHG